MTTIVCTRGRVPFLGGLCGVEPITKVAAHYV